ncbi:MAG TPA: hypothetical protein VGH90_12485, partial [Chthoniobacteraceae bacterium]
MHSRTGLKTEYLGAEWFECINACADEAERLGLEAWLYDEDRWPSGSAGGLATLEDHHRMKLLRLSIHETGPDFFWPERERFVGAFLADIEGLSFSKCSPLEYGVVPSSDSRKLLLFTTETWSGHSFYNGAAYLDTLSREAVDHFLEVTHERYRAHCGDRLGHSIRGIFTDEPHHGTVMCENNENRSVTDQCWTTPWTPMLWDEFRSAWSYDLRDHLPELFLFSEGRRISAVKWHYMELLQRLFLENWARPVHDWCAGHGLLLTGHYLHEDSLVGQAVPCGSVMRGYEHLDAPGIDVLGLHNRSFWIVKQLASVGRQLGRKQLLSELYGCSGWQLDFAGHKRIGAWQAILGISLRCPHLAWMTMEGEAKRDYPASIHFQSAWHRQYAAIEDYFARLHVLLGQGERVCDVLVVNPVESAWAQIHPGWARWLGAVDPELERLELVYRELFGWFAAAHLDFDYGDEDHLARFGKIEGDVGQPVFRVGAASYRVVVVAGMITMRRSTLHLLNAFQAAGGAVIFAGSPPGYLDAIPSESAWKLAARAVSVALDEVSLTDAVRRASCYPLRVTDPNGAASNDLLCQVRRDDERWIVAVVNTSENHAHHGICLSLGAEGTVEEWDCASGRRYAHPAEAGGQVTKWTIDLPPLGERVFVVVAKHSEALSKRPPLLLGESKPLAGAFSYALDEPNICVLDFAEYQLGGGPWQPAAEILQIDEAVRSALGFEQRSGVMLQPWAAAKLPADARSAPLHLRFRFEVDHLPSAPVELLMENPRAFRITLNGAEIAPPSSPAWFIDPCFQCISVALNALHPGENVIELQTDFTPRFDLEAIYLLGAFGVKLGDATPRLVSLPERLETFDAAGQGLPFYSGKITYRLPLPDDATKESRLEIDLGKFGGAVAQIRAPGEEQGILVCWPPYRVEVSELAARHRELLCDVWLTRRNTFGPLHLLPRDQSAIGPLSFHSKGEAFT